MKIGNHTIHADIKRGVAHAIYNLAIEDAKKMLYDHQSHGWIENPLEELNEYLDDLKQNESE
jgi:hypothetical protein